MPAFLVRTLLTYLAQGSTQAQLHYQTHILSEVISLIPRLFFCMGRSLGTRLDLLSPGKHNVITKLTYCLRLVFSHCSRLSFKFNPSCGREEIVKIFSSLLSLSLSLSLSTHQSSLSLFLSLYSSILPLSLSLSTHPSSLFSLLINPPSLSTHLSSLFSASPPNLPCCRVSNFLKLIIFLFWTLSAKNKKYKMRTLSTTKIVTKILVCRVVVEEEIMEI